MPLLALALLALIANTLSAEFVDVGIGADLDDAQPAIRGFSTMGASNKSLVYRELELLLRSHEGASWPPAACSASEVTFALSITNTLNLNATAYAVIVKVFDTVVTYVNTTGLVKAGTYNEQLNATEVAEYIVAAVNKYNASYSSGDPMADDIGRLLVGRCNVTGAALDYHPVKVPNYLRQPEQYSRDSFYVLGGLAGFCIVLQLGYGLYHGKVFDMIVLRDAD